MGQKYSEDLSKFQMDNNLLEQIQIKLQSNKVEENNIKFDKRLKHQMEKDFTRSDFKNKFENCEDIMTNIFNFIDNIYIKNTNKELKSQPNHALYDSVFYYNIIDKDTSNYELLSKSLNNRIDNTNDDNQINLTYNIFNQNQRIDSAEKTNNFLDIEPQNNAEIISSSIQHSLLDASTQSKQPNKSIKTSQFGQKNQSIKSSQISKKLNISKGSKKRFNSQGKSINNEETNVNKSLMKKKSPEKATPTLSININTDQLKEELKASNLSYVKENKKPKKHNKIPKKEPKFNIEIDVRDIQKEIIYSDSLNKQKNNNNFKSVNSNYENNYLSYNAIKDKYTFNEGDVKNNDVFMSYVDKFTQPNKKDEEIIHSRFQKKKNKSNAEDDM